MELKDVTRETHLQECDFLSQRTKNECYWHDVRTIGQLLDTPDSKIEEWHGWKAKSEIRLFFANYKNVCSPYDIETRTMFGKTFVKVLGCISTTTMCIKMFESERWASSELVDLVYEKEFEVNLYLVFASRVDKNYCYILKVIDK